MTIAAHGWHMQGLDARLHCMLLLFLLLFFLESLFRLEQNLSGEGFYRKPPWTGEEGMDKKLKVLKTNAPHPNLRVLLKPPPEHASRLPKKAHDLWGQGPRQGHAAPSCTQPGALIFPREAQSVREHFPLCNSPSLLSCL